MSVSRLPGLVLLILALAIYPSCKSSKPGASPSPDPPVVPPPIPCVETGTCDNGPNPDNSPDDLSDVMDPDSGTPLTRDTIKKLYQDVPATELTSADVIRKDWADGLLTRSEYLRQTICKLYEADCLEAKYKATTSDNRAGMCGSDDFNALWRELNRQPDEEAISLLEQLAQTGEPTAAPKATWKKAATGSSFYERLKRLAIGARVDTVDGQYCFYVQASDPWRGQMRYLNRKLAFSSGGKMFEIFHQEQHAAKAAMIKQAFEQGDIVGKFKALTPANPIAVDHDIAECNPTGAYRMFIVSGRTTEDIIGGGDTYHLTHLFSGTAMSYIDFRAEKLGICEKIFFVRDDSARCASEGQNAVNGHVAHEYMHAIENAHYGSTVVNDPCGDCLADWAIEYLFPDADSETSRLTGHLYRPDTAVGLDVGLKRYGSSLLFWFLRDMAGNTLTPITRFLNEMKGGQTLAKALEAAAQETSLGSFKKAWHAFAETSLNLKDAPDVHSFPKDHPSYRKEFLTRIAAVGPLPEYRLDSAIRKTSVQIKSLPSRAMRYVVLSNMSVTLNTANSSFKVDGSGWTGQGGSLSLISLKWDRSQPETYQVLRRDDLSTQGSIDICFDRPDSQPEIMLLVFSNGVSGSSLTGAVDIEAKPFCGDFALTASHRLSGEALGAGTTGSQSFTLDATMGFAPPQAAEPVVMYENGAVKITATSTSTEIFSNPAAADYKSQFARFQSQAQSLSATIGWSVSESKVSGDPRQCVTTTRYTAVGSRALGANDIVTLPLTYMDAGGGKGSYAIGVLIQDPKTREYPVAYSTTCQGAQCGQGCGGSGQETWTIDLPSISGLYRAGAKVLSQADSEADSDPSDQTTWNVTLPSPLEVQSMPSPESALQTMYYLPPHRLQGQFKPPIIDAR